MVEVRVTRVSDQLSIRLNVGVGVGVGVGVDEGCEVLDAAAVGVSVADGVLLAVGAGAEQPVAAKTAAIPSAESETRIGVFKTLTFRGIWIVPRVSLLL